MQTYLPRLESQKWPFLAGYPAPHRAWEATKQHSRPGALLLQFPSRGCFANRLERGASLSSEAVDNRLSALLDSSS
jgi:hypothetical protein